MASEQVLPFYLVCDKSASMDLNDGIRTVNDCLPELHQEIGGNPVVADKTRFSIIAFSTEAEVVLDLADLSDVVEMPKLEATGTTSYGAAFKLLQATIDRDISRLKAEGHAVFRPVVFFLSDGQPTDNWEADHEALIDPTFGPRPHIIAFGVGDATADTITKVATFKAFIQNGGETTPANALREFGQALTKSIVASVTTIAPDGAPVSLQVEDTVAGFTSLPLDTV